MNKVLKTYIYVLKDLENNVRYVGKSNNPNRRLLVYHIPQSKKKRTHKECWIFSLLKEGKKPLLEILEVVDINNWVEREKFYIKFYRELGCNLVNSTDGGESYNISDDIKLKISKKMKNNIHSSKRVIQYDTNIAIVNQFPSIAEAERITKIPASNICKTLKGVTSTAGGFYWSYVDNKPKLNVMAHKKIIYQIDVNGNVINRFGSIKEASIEINRDPSSIQKALDIPNRKSGAYRWVSEIKSLK